MPTKIAIGIDPGVSGAVAWIVAGGAEPSGVCIDTRDFLSLRGIIQQWRPMSPQEAGTVVAGVEGTSAMFGWSGRANYVLGACGASAQCAVQSVGIPLVMVDPKQWRGEALAGMRTRLDRKGSTLSGKNAYQQRKADTLEAARRRWPSLAETILKTKAKGGAVADALFIALYVGRKEGLLS